MIRVFFVKKDQSVKVETTDRTEYMVWEESDGYHAFPVESIFKHSGQMCQPIVIFTADIVSPYGSCDSARTLNTLVTIIDIIKDGKGKINKSSLFGRFFRGIYKYIFLIIIIVILIYAIFFSGGNPNGVKIL